MTSDRAVKIMKQRDGFKCLYCDEPFTETHPAEIEHLDNNPKHNEIWNKTFAHHDCNCKKIRNTDLHIIAGEKIISNQKYLSVCAGMNKKLGTTEDLTSCQSISNTNFREAEMYISEHTLIDGYLYVKEAVNDIVGLCRKKYNTGSQSAVYRYLNTLTSIAYPYEFASNSGEDIIRRRTGN